MRLRAALAAAALFAAAAAHAELSETEQRIVAAVKARKAEALGLLERATRINSGTSNLEGVRATGEIFRAELAGLGFATRWVDLPAEVKRASHLVAEREGPRGKRLLLLGHLDTVFGRSSKAPAWEPRGEVVRGQGVSDMKGGIVVLVEALRALHAVGALDGATIAVMLTSDEEGTGTPLEATRGEMVALAKKSDAALSFEGINKVGAQETAVVSRRAQSRWSLRVAANPGHSSRIFSEAQGYGAIFEGARILDQFRERLAEPGVTFNPGIVAGGTSVKSEQETAGSVSVSGRRNVIAGELVVHGDLRFLTPEQGERVRARMREIVAASLPGATSTIEFVDRYPAMPPSEANRALLDQYSKVSQDAGFGPVVAGAPDSRGAGDIQFTAPYVAGLDGLGAHGRFEHTDNEELEVASIERGAIRAALFIHRLTR